MLMPAITLLATITTKPPLAATSAAIPAFAETMASSMASASAITSQAKPEVQSTSGLEPKEPNEASPLALPVRTQQVTVPVPSHVAPQNVDPTQPPIYLARQEAPASEKPADPAFEAPQPPAAEPPSQTIEPLPRAIPRSSSALHRQPTEPDPAPQTAVATPRTTDPARTRQSRPAVASKPHALEVVLPQAPTQTTSPALVIPPNEATPVPIQPARIDHLSTPSIVTSSNAANPSPSNAESSQSPVPNHSDASVDQPPATPSAQITIFVTNLSQGLVLPSQPMAALPPEPHKPTTNPSQPSKSTATEKKSEAVTASPQLAVAGPPATAPAPSILSTPPPFTQYLNPQPATSASQAIDSKPHPVGIPSPTHIAEATPSHTTLQSGPTILEIGVPGGTHGWLRIRAEIGDGGTIQASLSSTTPSGHATLHHDLPEMKAFLAGEQVAVQLHVAPAPESPSSAPDTPTSNQPFQQSSDSHGGNPRQQPKPQSSQAFDTPDPDYGTPALSLHGGSWVNVVA